MRELERRFERELVVVGVHSGKFIAERVTANIASAMMRLGLNHPVVNDRQYRTWRAYAVNAWPTLVLVNPGGYIVGQHAGEATADQLTPIVARVIEAAERDGSLDRRRLEFPAESIPTGPLLFPEKVALDASGELLAIADTGHHRVILARIGADGREATVEVVIGSGEPGLRDGNADGARFHRPHGVAFDEDGGGRIFVADTENHAIRAVDSRTGTVATFVGNGSQARGWPLTGGAGGDVALNSPWDLVQHEGMLYVAMAGSHQLWTVDPGSGRARPWVGSGAEALHDGVAGNAALAQPSGLAVAGGRLWFADSESSAIRWATLPGGHTGTVVGTGLFDFGDRNGAGDDVRLQHPLGIAAAGDRLLIADTYNGVLKWVDPADRSARRWPVDIEGDLWEPGGLAVAGRRVVVADTNHHRLLTGELGGAELSELPIRGLDRGR